MTTCACVMVCECREINRRREPHHVPTTCYVITAHTFGGFNFFFFLSSNFRNATTSSRGVIRYLTRGFLLVLSSGFTARTPRRKQQHNNNMLFFFFFVIYYCHYIPSSSLQILSSGCDYYWRLYVTTGFIIVCYYDAFWYGRIRACWKLYGPAMKRAGKRFYEFRANRLRGGKNIKN